MGGEYTYWTRLENIKGLRHARNNNLTKKDLFQDCLRRILSVVDHVVDSNQEHTRTVRYLRL